jgi:hypothetical protein
MGGSAALALVRDAGLTGLVRSGGEHVLGEAGSERLLPVLAELRPLLVGGGLRRGATVAVATGSVATGSVTSGPVAPSAAGEITARPVAARPGAAPEGRVAPGPAPAATSVLLALLAEASRVGSWCAVVGVPTLGVAAAAELGVALDRLALVPHPGPEWPTVVAALLDGFDIVVAAAPGQISAGIAGRLAARARQRGNVLVPYGPWPGADLTLEAVDAVWHGLGSGRGRLRGRQLTIVARGRGAAAVPRRTWLWLPRATGPAGVAPLEPAALAREPAVLASVHPIRRARPVSAGTRAG